MEAGPNEPPETAARTGANAGDSGPVPRIYAFHKPKGVVVSTVSQAGSPTVFERLPAEYSCFLAVGRLDKESEGLLLFCSDARLAQRLMDPGGLPKTYVVTVRGLPREQDLDAMRSGGLVVDGRPLRPVEICRLGKAPRGGTRFAVVLHEGRNRQIRRMFRAAGFRVRRLVRVAIGPVELGSIAAGCGRELEPSEVSALCSLVQPRPARGNEGRTRHRMG
jgi:pseudouridine synthase